MTLSKRLFGKTSKGEEVYLYKLSNQNGCSVEILTLGGIIHSFLVPNANGKMADIVTGLETVQDYEKNPAYFGAIIGRVTNRLKGKFEIDGKEIHLNCNVGNVCQHGGVSGFDKKLWEHQSGCSEEGQWVELTYTSADGEEGFPGVLEAKVAYKLERKSHRLVVNMQAKSTSATIVNLTNHAYFNLNGHESNSLKGHFLTVNADHYLPLDNSYLPTGEVRQVENSMLDMREEVQLDQVVEKIVDVAGVRGLDHNFCVNGYKAGAAINTAAVLRTSDRVLTLQTDQPGLQVYTGNHLDGSITGKGGVAYGRHSCVALEPQKWPDAPCQANFPSILLLPNDTYKHTSVYTFST